jgi:hypothetical protein
MDSRTVPHAGRTLHGTFEVESIDEPRGLISPDIKKGTLVIGMPRSPLRGHEAGEEGVHVGGTRCPVRAGGLRVDRVLSDVRGIARHPSGESLGGLEELGQGSAEGHELGGTTDCVCVVHETRRGEHVRGLRLGSACAHLRELEVRRSRRLRDGRGVRCSQPGRALRRGSSHRDP